MRVDPDAQYDTREKRLAYIDEVLRRTRALPGVEAAGISDALPLGRNRTWGARAKGVTYERGRAPSAFPADRQRRLSRGDGHSAQGRPRHLAAGHGDERPVIVINETMARTLWPGQDPIGKIVLNACSPERRVIGVVGDVRHLALEQRSGNEMYIPLRQCGDLPTTDLVVRSSQATAPLVGRGPRRR